MKEEEKVNWLENLCIYDERNPDRLEGETSKGCPCDNCFYGLTKLANAHLDYIDGVMKYVRLKTLKP